MSLHDKWPLIIKDTDQSYPSETPNFLDETHFKYTPDVFIATGVATLGSSNKSFKLSGA